MTFYVITRADGKRYNADSRTWRHYVDHSPMARFDERETAERIATGLGEDCWVQSIEGWIR